MVKAKVVALIKREEATKEVLVNIGAPELTTDL